MKKEIVIDNVVTKLFDKSQAFLEAAIVTSAAKESELFNTSEYLNVTAHLLHHATELFLKSTISAYTKSLPENEHNIFNLYKTYKKLYPTEEFNIRIPFIEERKYTGFSKEQIAQYEKDFSMSVELQLRYPIDMKGNCYSPITKFTTGYLELCKKTFCDIHCKLLSF